MYFAVRGLTLLRHPLKDVLDRLRFELASIARACAVLLCEQDVVILLAFERWVEVHKIKNGFVLDVPTQDIQTWQKTSCITATILMCCVGTSRTNPVLILCTSTHRSKASRITTSCSQRRTAHARAMDASSKRRRSRTSLSG